MSLKLKLEQAVSVPAATPGSVSLFIDTKDGMLKTKDQFGTVTELGTNYNKSCPDCYILYRDTHPITDCPYSIIEQVMES